MRPVIICLLLISLLGITYATKCYKTFDKVEEMDAWLKERVTILHFAVGEEKNVWSKFHFIYECIRWPDGIYYPTAWPNY